MKKYRQVLQNTVATYLEYRAELLSAMFLELIPLLSLLIFWFAVFRSQSSLGGMSLSSTITYYALLPLIGFITTCSLSNEFGYQIRRGEFSHLLLKPFSIWWYIFSFVVGKKISQLGIVVPVYLVVLAVINAWFVPLHLSFLTVISGLFFSMIGFLLSFAIEMSITWIAFWVDEVWSFRHFKEIVTSFLGGKAFPFVFVSKAFQTVLSYLPFQYLYYVPAGYFMGTRSLATSFLPDLFAVTLWSGLFIGLGSLIWRKGVKKYGAFGN